MANIDCYYYYEGAWVLRTASNAISPFGQTCQSYSYCGHNHTQSWESDSYYIMCNECEDNHSPTDVVPPAEYFRPPFWEASECGGTRTLENGNVVPRGYVSQCLHAPTAAPSAAPSLAPTNPGGMPDPTPEPEVIENEPVYEPARSASEQLKHFYTGKNSGVAWGGSAIVFLGVVMGFYKISKSKGDSRDSEYDSDDSDYDSDETETSEESEADWGHKKGGGGGVGGSRRRRRGVGVGVGVGVGTGGGAST